MTIEEAPEPAGLEEDRDFDRWLQTATRFFVLTNAGGAVAVLSFIGTSLASGGVRLVAVASLFCFVAGLIVAGFVILGQLTRAYLALLTATIGPVAAADSINRNWMTRLSAPVEPRTGGYIGWSLLLFMLGAAIGLIALLRW